MTVGIRESLYQLLDKLIIASATRKYALFGPSIIYQPLPWLNLVEGRRTVGCQRRRSAIKKYLEEQSMRPSITLDVGANIGYFSLSFAEMGAVAYAVEAEPLNMRIANIARNQMPPDTGTFVPLRLMCTAENAELLPSSNVTLCLSIWHHWVRHIGLDGATQILRVLLKKTSDVLFFDTGENEMPGYYNLPFAGHDSKIWLNEYLCDLNGGDGVSCIGEYEAFTPSTDENAGNVTRSLFAIQKR